MTRFALVLTSLLGAVHCGGGTTTPISTTTGDGGVPPGPPPSNLPTPKEHRVTAAACPTARPPGVNSDAGAPDSGVPSGQCLRDSDCTQGNNGRCEPASGRMIGNMCTYDACVTDVDCGDGKVCACGTPLGTVPNGTPMRTGNRCLPGNCRVDADCGTGSFCSPSLDATCGPYFGVTGYYCHTAGDTCTSDDQCKGIGPGYCAFQPTVGKWACGTSVCAG